MASIFPFLPLHIDVKPRNSKEKKHDQQRQKNECALTSVEYKFQKKIGISEKKMQTLSKVTLESLVGVASPLGEALGEAGVGAGPTTARYV